MVVVLAINDKKTLPLLGALAPVVLFLLVLGIGASIGMQTGMRFFSLSMLVFNILNHRLRHQPGSRFGPTDINRHGRLWDRSIYV